ncbi:MAG: ATP-binding protein [Bacteroidia bacterium]
MGLGSRRVYLVSVEDNGIGIDPRQNKESLFGCFKRFHFHVRKGMGLHMVRKSVGSDEDISESQPGVGTKFLMKIPEKIWMRE